ncbi:hypothetical protein ACIBL8_46420 [Streptomyces sp. NPDC050523]|uniref:hypothetical protein n=1 Tax=Streptomyces sp. NPDC050523 TaxID=3365622 RepID=UPI0037BAB7F2
MLDRATAVTPLTWIVEVADETLVLEPAHRRVAWETSTWSLGATDEDRTSLSAVEVMVALEWTSSGIRDRMRDLGSSGVVTFYVWRQEFSETRPLEGFHVVRWR